MRRDGGGRGGGDICGDETVGVCTGAGAAGFDTGGDGDGDGGKKDGCAEPGRGVL